MLALLMVRARGGAVSLYPQVLVQTMAFSLFVECTQLFFVEGHFRLRDLFANLIGILSALAFHYLAYRHACGAQGAERAIRAWQPIGLPAVLLVALATGLNAMVRWL